MDNNILTEIKNKQAIDVYRRNLQKLYINRLIEIIKPPAPVVAVVAAPGGRRAGGQARELAETDAISAAKGQLRMINDMIKAAIPATTDTMTSYHLQDLSDRITVALNPKS